MKSKYSILLLVFAVGSNLQLKEIYTHFTLMAIYASCSYDSLVLCARMSTK